MSQSRTVDCRKAGSKLPSDPMCCEKLPRVGSGDDTKTALPIKTDHIAATAGVATNRE